MAVPFKFNPIILSDSHVASFRRKLTELVKRMNADYERELKPLILKMNERQRQKVQTQKEFAALPELIAVKDATKYYTAYEVSRLISTLKSRVLHDIAKGLIPEAMKTKEGEWLIPETAVEDYADKIGKRVPESDPLMKQFNERLHRLQRKYQDLLYAYQNMAEQEAQKTFKEAKDKFRKQFAKSVGINILNIMAEKGLTKAYEAQVEANVNLIKSLPEKYFSDIKHMTIQNATGQKVFEGGLIQAIMDLTGTTKLKAKLIARDQTSKAVATFSHLRMQNIGVIGYEWNNANDRRVAGNPGGLYPNADPNSRTHGDHWERQGKFYLFNRMSNPPLAPNGKPFRQPPPDGSPGMAIQCRCFSNPVIPELERDTKNLNEMRRKK